MKRLEQRIYAYLPHKPYCSSDKTASLVRTQAYAVKFPYIQLNNLTQCAWLIFDCDHNDTSIWEENHLPSPNYIAINKESGHFHVAYAISAVATSEKARAKPLLFLAAIQRTYTRLLNADPNYVGLITKNPLNIDWKVVVLHTAQYDLSELHDAVGTLDSKKYGQCISPNLVGYERNCELFHVTRFYAYANIKNAEELGFTGWFEFLLAYVEAQNESYAAIHITPLMFNEVKGIASSVAKWTYQRRFSIRTKERKLQLDTNQPLETRQSVGAYYSHQVRKDSVLEKMTNAHQALLKEGVNITQKAVKDRAGVSIITVKRYWKIIKS